MFVFGGGGGGFWGLSAAGTLGRGRDAPGLAAAEAEILLARRPPALYGDERPSTKRAHTATICAPSPLFPFPLPGSRAFENSTHSAARKIEGRGRPVFGRRLSVSLSLSRSPALPPGPHTMARQQHSRTTRAGRLLPLLLLASAAAAVAAARPTPTTLLAAAPPASRARRATLALGAAPPARRRLSVKYYEEKGGDIPGPPGPVGPVGPDGPPGEDGEPGEQHARAGANSAQERRRRRRARRRSAPPACRRRAAHPPAQTSALPLNRPLTSLCCFS